MRMTTSARMIRTAWLDIAGYELDTRSKRKQESHLRQNSLACASCLYLLTLRMNLALAT